MRMISVLIADDEPIIRERLLYCVEWGEIGFEVCAVAENGNQALDMIRDKQPDVALLDINMPGLNGLSVAETVCLEYPSLYLVFITGYASFEYAHRAICANACNYLLKPIQKEELADTLCAIKDRIRKSQRETRTATDINSLKDRMREDIHEYALQMKKQSGGIQSDVVRKAIRYIHEFYTDSQLNLTKLAQNVHVSPAYLSCIFTREAGITLNAYIQEKRMMEAARKIIHEGQNVMSTATDVGYNDPYYFSRCFKKYFGISPSQIQNP